MTSRTLENLASVGSGTFDQAVVVRRIRFTSEPPAGGSVRRRYTQPHPAVAVQEIVELRDLPAEAHWPEPVDRLHVILAPQGGPAEWRKKIDAWLAPPDQSEAQPTVLVELEGCRIQWRPGKALIQGPADRSEALLDALIDFAFYEGELRRLEQTLLPYETNAPGDVALAYRIKTRHKSHWERLGRTIECLYTLRLTFARLEPRLVKGARSMPVEGRRAMSRLLAKTDAADRLEALSDRLEACEDLYEGAIDRITDFRWYLKGYLMEIAIVVLLGLEVIFLLLQFWVH